MHQIYCGGCVFCPIPLLFVCLSMRISSETRSIAGMPFDSAGRFRATLLLRTTCMRSCCNRIASCVAALEIILDLPFGFPINNIISLAA